MKIPWQREQELRVLAVPGSCCLCSAPAVQVPLCAWTHVSWGSKRVGMWHGESGQVTPQLRLSLGFRGISLRGGVFKAISVFHYVRCSAAAHSFRGHAKFSSDSRGWKKITKHLFL